MADDFGMLLAIVGWVGAAVMMIVHLVGILLGTWANDSVTFVFPLIFLALMQIGGAMSNE